MAGIRRSEELPIWAFSVTSKIGVMLLKNGLEFVDKPKKVGK